MGATMARIFISYSQADRQFVDEFVLLLRRFPSRRLRIDVCFRSRENDWEFTQSYQSFPNPASE